MITFLVVLLVVAAAVISIQLIELLNQRKIIRIYEAMVDNAISNLGAVNQITDFGMENGMEPNMRGVNDSIKYVLYQLQQDNQRAKKEEK